MNTNFRSVQPQPVCDGNALRRLVLLAGARRCPIQPKQPNNQLMTVSCFQCKGMLWFLKSVLHIKEPEDGICSVSRFLLPDFWDTNPPRLLQQKWVPLLGSWGPREAAYPTCAGWWRTSTQRAPWWLCTAFPSADSVKGWAFFKFMHILLSSNIKCFFFVIGTGACFDRRHFRSQITKARLEAVVNDLGTYTIVKKYEWTFFVVCRCCFQNEPVVTRN